MRTRSTTTTRSCPVAGSSGSVYPLVAPAFGFSRTDVSPNWPPVSGTRWGRRSTSGRPCYDGTARRKITENLLSIVGGHGYHTATAGILSRPPTRRGSSGRSAVSQIGKMGTKPTPGGGESHQRPTTACQFPQAPGRFPRTGHILVIETGLTVQRRLPSWTTRPKGRPTTGYLVRTVRVDSGQSYPVYRTPFPVIREPSRCVTPPPTVLRAGFSLINKILIDTLPFDIQ